MDASRISPTFISIRSSIVELNVQVIAHQTNCQGVMGAGVAKVIRDAYPEIYHTYQTTCRANHMLGQCQMIQTRDGKYVANVFGQDRYGRMRLDREGKRIPYTDYRALKSALKSLSLQMSRMGLETVAFPYLMGCRNGGGDWKKVRELILETFQGNEKVYVCSPDFSFDERPGIYL